MSRVSQPDLRLGLEASAVQPRSERDAIFWLASLLIFIGLAALARGGPSYMWRCHFTRPPLCLTSSGVVALQARHPSQLCDRLRLAPAPSRKLGRPRLVAFW